MNAGSAGDPFGRLFRRRRPSVAQQRLGIALLLLSVALTISSLAQPTSCADPDAQPLTFPLVGSAEGPVCLTETLIAADVYELFGSGRWQAATFRPRADTPDEALEGNVLEVRPAQGAEPAKLRSGGEERQANGAGPWALASGDLRGGDALVAMEGELRRTGDRWTVFAHTLVIERRAPRPPPPPRAAGRVRVVSANLLNYFVTLGSRGATDAVALGHQTDKWVATLLALDADAIALQEIENDDGAALDHLLRALNDAQTRAGRPASAAYVAVPPGARGGDAIRVAIAYRPAVLTLSGAVSDPAPVHDRPPQAALFRAVDGGEFALITAHHRSKGGCPVAGDVDAGFGCWNLRRSAQSEALWSFAERYAAPGALVVGDLNAYAHEPPLTPWRDASWVPLVDRMPAERATSFVYFGRAGALDHAIVSPTLAERATATYWGVNADEPFGTDATAPTPYRASDHDPLIVDLALR